MAETTLTSKGQTTIPKEIRDGLGLKAGDRITFTMLADGAVIMRVKTASLGDLYGAVKAKAHVTGPQMTPWT